ncbi:MAG: hypothetical protein FWF43_06105 [Propionibacteriaceae bacterium]|nr:hypothetical protein [Propionibacteriaceae bacterium]
MSWERTEPEMTGVDKVDQALKKVAGLPEAPLDQHPQILRDAQDALDELLRTDAS